MGCRELDFDINSIELFAIAEPFREQIKSIAIETGIDEKITQSIADELSQRMHNNSIGLAPPITKVPAWLKSIALTALAGKPIIGAGIEISLGGHKNQVIARFIAKLGQISRRWKIISKGRKLFDFDAISNTFRNPFKIGNG